MLTHNPPPAAPAAEPGPGPEPGRGALRPADRLASRRLDADLLHLVRANADGMLVLDEHGDVRHANPAAARLLGAAPDDLVGEPFGIPLAPTDAEEEPDPVEIEIHRPGHPARPEGTAELRCSPCTWAGRPATLVSLRDVTERKRMVAELRESQRRLRRLSAALQQSQLAERLRVSELVEEAVERPIRLARAEARAAARREPASREAAERIVASLDEALEASERTREELFPPDLDGGGLAAAARWLAGRFEQRDGLRVHVRVEDSFEEPGDERLRGFLFLAARELLHNVARHASSPDADVVLSCDAGCGRIELEVRDRGVGYETTGPRDPARLARRPLRGLGLFNLEQTVLHRGGELRIHSGPGEGTRVRLSVPDNAMSAEAGEESVVFPPPAATPPPGRA